MRLYNLGELPRHQSVTVFHALARRGIEALILASPRDPMVGIGYFEDAAHTLDVDYCRAHGIGIMRREVGGGTVLLDRHQVFYFVVLRKDHPLASRHIMKVYRRFSEAPIRTYRRFGIDVRFRPINDLVTTEGKKIAGEGGGDIADMMVFVGGILLDFDYATMVKVLRVPDEKFRDKVYTSMTEHLTTMKRELGVLPSMEDVKAVLVEEFERILGPIEPAALTADLMAEMDALETQFTSDACLFGRTRNQEVRVKIREGVEVREGVYKAPGGLIRSITTVKEGCIEDIELSGDFTFFPKARFEGLERALIGARMDREEVGQRLQSLYASEEIDAPGVTPEDFVQCLLGRS